MAGGEDGADGVGDDTELRRFSDVELLEKSRRIQGELSGGIERRLKDRGAKFRRLLDAIVREIDRRKAATDDDRCARVVQSGCAESSGMGLICVKILVDLWLVAWIIYDWDL
jgi:hypothetical protein